MVRWRCLLNLTLFDDVLFEKLWWMRVLALIVATEFLTPSCRQSHRILSSSVLQSSVLPTTWPCHQVKPVSSEFPTSHSADRSLTVSRHVAAVSRKLVFVTNALCDWLKGFSQLLLASRTPCGGIISLSKAMTCCRVWNKISCLNYPWKNKNQEEDILFVVTTVELSLYTIFKF